MAERAPMLPADLLFTDDLLTEEEREIRAAARTLVDDLIRPHIADWYERGELPARELAAQFGAAGLLGMHLDGYGCAGVSTIGYGLACLELEAGDSGIRSLVSVQGSLVMFPIHAYGSDEQKDRYLPGMAAGEIVGCFGLTEPDSGSDPGSMRTRARRTSGGYRIDGVKMWITNGTIADVAVVWAKLAEDGPDGPAGMVRGFLVPTGTPGFSAREVKGKLSLRASATAELVLDGVEVPGDAILPGVKGLRGPLSCLTQARTGILFGALGAARDCLATAIDYAKVREQFGRPLAAFQLTQAKIADMATAWTSAYVLALQIGKMSDTHGPRPAATSMGKLNSTRTALQIARTCRTILGGNGITGEYPVMRHASNLETVLTYEGTAEVHQLVLGKELTGFNAFS